MRNPREWDARSLPGAAQAQVCLVVASAAGVLAAAVREPLPARDALLLDDGTDVHLTCSIGVASAAPGERWDLRDLLRAADDALYAAKHAGRHRAHAAAVVDIPTPPSGSAVRSA